MKKIISHILIALIIILGVSTPFMARADGFCYTPSGSKVLNVNSKAQCEQNNVDIWSTVPPTCNWKLEILTLFGCGPIVGGLTESSAKANVTNTSNYTLLAPLSNQLITFNPDPNTNPYALAQYLNIMIKIIIGLCAVLAMIMIFAGGIEYMTSELVSSKEHGKSRITNAILGLILALGAYALLFTINPDLLNTELKNLTTQNLQVTLKDEPEIGNPSKSVSVTTPDGQQVNLTVGQDIVTVHIFDRDVEVYKGVAKSLLRISAAWQAKGGQKFYAITDVEGYNPRTVTANPNFWSAHAFGLAIDINPDKNPYQTASTPMKTDMPDDFINLFKAEGWGWGGSWTSLKDPMHFSKMASESGNRQVEAYP